MVWIIQKGDWRPNQGGGNINTDCRHRGKEWANRVQISILLLQWNFVLWELVGSRFRATTDPLIDTASSTHHINRSFISHQKPFASPWVKAAEIEQTRNFCLHIYLSSLSKHLLQALQIRASESQSYHFSVCDPPAEKTKRLKRDPNGWCSQAAWKGTCSLPVVILCVRLCVCVCV